MRSPFPKGTPVPNYEFRSIVLVEAQQHLLDLAGKAFEADDPDLAFTFDLAAATLADALHAIHERSPH